MLTSSYRATVCSREQPNRWRANVDKRGGRGSNPKWRAMDHSSTANASRFILKSKRKGLPEIVDRSSAFRFHHRGGKLYATGSTRNVWHRLQANDRCGIMLPRGRIVPAPAMSSSSILYIFLSYFFLFFTRRYYRQQLVSVFSFLLQQQQGY